MARPNRSTPRTDPIALTLRRADLAAQLDQRIALGRALEVEQVSLFDESVITAWRDRYRRWHEYNVTLLTRSFTTNKEASNYDWSAGAYLGGPTSLDQVVRQTRSEVHGRIEKLQSLRERLELFDEDEALSTTAASILNVEEQRTVEKVVTEFRKAEQEGDLDSLDHNDRAEAEAEVETLEAQLHSPRPKRSIVSSALRSLGDILHRGLGSAAGAGIVVVAQEAVKLIH